MAESEHGNREVAKTFTRTRRIPQLIGRTSDGARIPGGPYTMTQALGGFAVGCVLYLTMGLWGGGSAIWNWLMALTAVGVAVFLLGRLPIGGRNPMSVLLGFGNATLSMRPSAVGGMAAPRTKVHAVTGEVVIRQAPAVVDQEEASVRRSRRRADGPVRAVAVETVGQEISSEPEVTAAPEPRELEQRDRRRSEAEAPAVGSRRARRDEVAREAEPAQPSGEPRLRAIPGGRIDGPGRAASKTSVNRLLALAEQQQKKEA